jgi:hypothetical protein
MAWDDEKRLYVFVYQCGELSCDLEWKQVEDCEWKEEPQAGDDEGTEDGCASRSYIDNGHDDIRQARYVEDEPIP